MNYIHKFPLFHQKFSLMVPSDLAPLRIYLVLKRAHNPKITNRFTRTFYTKSEKFPEPFGKNHLKVQK